MCSKWLSSFTVLPWSLTHIFFFNGYLNHQRRQVDTCFYRGTWDSRWKHLASSWDRHLLCKYMFLIWSFKFKHLDFVTSTRLLCWRLTARCSGATSAVLRMLGSAPRSSRALQLSSLFFSTAQWRGALPSSSHLFNPEWPGRRASKTSQM